MQGRKPSENLQMGVHEHATLAGCSWGCEYSIRSLVGRLIRAQKSEDQLLEFISDKHEMPKDHFIVGNRQSTEI